MTKIGDLLIIKEIKNNKDEVFSNYVCVVTDSRDGIMELMPQDLFMSIYTESHNFENNYLYYYVDQEDKYSKLGKIDRLVMSDLFTKLNHLKGDNVFEYVMPH